MIHFSKKTHLLPLCAALLAAGSLFAVSAATRTAPAAHSPAPAGALVRAEAPAEPGTAAQETAGAPQTEPGATAAQPVPQTEAETGEAPGSRQPSEKETEQTDAPSVLSLTTTAPETTVRSDQFTAIGPFNVRKDSVLSVRANTKISDHLASANDAHAYTFSVTERGVLQIGFNYGVAEVTGTPWILYLYENYSSDGTAENDAWRMLTMLNVPSGKTETLKTEKIGLYPGDYAIVAATGDSFSAADYEMAAAFVANTPWEAEPNNTKTRYNELAPGVKTGGSSANTAAGDEDVFLITVPARGAVSLLFEHEKLGGTGVGWILTLRNEAGETLYRERAYSQEAQTFSGEIGLPPGAYYLTVTAHLREDADYYLTCDYRQTDAFETETNDSRDAATDVAIEGRAVSFGGSLSEKYGVPDVDNYRFTLPSDGVISFAFLHKDLLRPRDGWRIVLSDEAGEELFRMNSRWNETSVASPQIGLSAGTYYLTVDGEDMLFTCETYTVNLTFAAGKNWEAESNDAPETANPLTPDTIRYGTLVSAGLLYDADYYVFTLPKTATVSLTLSHNLLSGTGEGWRVSLLDQSGSTLTAFTSRWDQRTAESGLLTLPAGTYYVRVDTGTIFSSAKYGLTVNTR